MRGVAGLAAAVAAAAFFVSASTARAELDGPANPHFLFFSGADLWRSGEFVHGGVVLAPAGLDAEGFTLKLLVGGGRYTYYSGGLSQDVSGQVLSAAAMPGWRFKRDGFIVTLFAGADMQDHRLSPDDPGARLRGFYLGARIAGEVWYQPDARTMVASDGMLSSTGPTGTFRAAVGWRVFEPVFIGPETQMIWCADYQQLRLGAHVTGLRTEAVEWSAAAGWARDSDGRDGPYVRLGVMTRY
jgi:hypothetical protein